MECDICEGMERIKAMCIQTGDEVVVPCPYCVGDLKEVNNDKT